MNFFNVLFIENLFPLNLWKFFRDSHWMQLATHRVTEKFSVDYYIQMISDLQKIIVLKGNYSHHIRICSTGHVGFYINLRTWI